jgi:hypothetical protein
MAVDAALAGWPSAQEAAMQQASVADPEATWAPQDGIASLVLLDRGSPWRLVVDPGSVDAVIASGSICTLLGADLTGHPTR